MNSGESPIPMSEAGAAECHRGVVDFIARELSVPLQRLAPDTTLFGDLGVAGDDGADLMKSFSREFGVDIDAFESGLHFGGEGFSPIAFVHWIRDLLTPGTPEEHAGFVPITVGDLVQAARTRRWTCPADGGGSERRGEKEVRGRRGL
jgi:hypothetical protein